MHFDNPITFNFCLTCGIAYLDPGSGSFILQILLASLLGALYFARIYWQKILSLFRKSSNKSADEQIVREEEQVE